MKRGFGYTICLIITLSIFVGVFTNTTTVNAYQNLLVGDQLLYEFDWSYYWDIEQSYLYETEIPMSFESYKFIDHTEFNATDYHSFEATNPTPTYVDGRYTWNSIDYYRNDLLRNYAYNYTLDYWEVIDTTSSTDLITYSESYLSFADVYSGILNFDFSTYFSFTSYNYSTAKSYDINGIPTMCSVDVYTYYQDSLIQNPYDYYNISYWEDNYYGFEIVYYVDSITGFLLEYDFLYYDFYYAYFNDYSTDLAMNVEYFYNDIYISAENWKLFETNAGYTPVLDADLPYLLIDLGACDFEIYPSMDELSIFFDIGDSSSLMILEVYLNGFYHDGFSGLTEGYYEYPILTEDIPMDENGHELMFVLYDQNNLYHNTTWYWWLDDIRPEFPVIQEWDVTYNYEIGTEVTNNWKLRDNDPNFFEMKFDGLVVASGIYYDYMHVTYTMDGNITVPGDYLVSIYANDLSGHETFYDVIIHVYENASLDSIAPEIDGSNGLIKIEVGEDRELKWVLSDANLCCYEIWMNDTFVEQQDAWDQTIEVYFELSTLDLGVWNITIIVHDTYGNIASEEVTVTVVEVGTEPTEPSEPTDPSNTITLDAPQVLYAALGILSILALTYTIRKRR